MKRLLAACAITLLLALAVPLGAAFAQEPPPEPTPDSASAPKPADDNPTPDASPPAEPTSLRPAAPTLEASPAAAPSPAPAADPLISPAEGAAGSRFQVVGQAGWTPGETVRLRIALTAADPAAYDGPFYREREVTVLPDGTWSFPFNVTDELFPFPLPAEPAYIIVEATSGSRMATTVFVYAPGGRHPGEGPALADLGFGAAGSPPAAVIGALFAAATGAMLCAAGAMRRRSMGSG